MYLFDKIIIVIIGFLFVSLCSGQSKFPSTFIAQRVSSSSVQRIYCDEIVGTASYDQLEASVGSFSRVVITLNSRPTSQFILFPNIASHVLSPPLCIETTPVIPIPHLPPITEPVGSGTGSVNGAPALVFSGYDISHWVYVQNTSFPNIVVPLADSYASGGTQIYSSFQIAKPSSSIFLLPVCFPILPTKTDLISDEQQLILQQQLQQKLQQQEQLQQEELQEQDTLNLPPSYSTKMTSLGVTSQLYVDDVNQRSANFYYYGSTITYITIFLGKENATYDFIPSSISPTPCLKYSATHIQPVWPPLNYIGNYLFPSIGVLDLYTSGFSLYIVQNSTPFATYDYGLSIYSDFIPGVPDPKYFVLPKECFPGAMGNATSVTKNSGVDPVFPNTFTMITEQGTKIYRNGELDYTRMEDSSYVTIQKKSDVYIFSADELSKGISPLPCSRYSSPQPIFSVPKFTHLVANGSVEGTPAGVWSQVLYPQNLVSRISYWYLSVGPVVVPYFVIGGDYEGKMDHFDVDVPPVSVFDVPPSCFSGVVGIQQEEVSNLIGDDKH